jgi:uncharacterized protein YaiI (UPF0178 family)
MQIWVDGDACPKTIKAILFRVATRARISTIIVSNHYLSVPASTFIKKIIVGAGFDVVDNYIVNNLGPNDLVITADIPFADAVITKGGFALNPRGELYSSNNIKQHLSSRNLNESIRSSGLITGGPSKENAKETQKFANALDSWVTKNHTPKSLDSDD